MSISPPSGNSLHRRLFLKKSNRNSTTSVCSTCKVLWSVPHARRVNGFRLMCPDCLPAITSFMFMMGKMRNRSCNRLSSPTDRASCAHETLDGAGECRCVCTKGLFRGKMAFRACTIRCLGAKMRCRACTIRCLGFGQAVVRARLRLEGSEGVSCVHNSSF